MDYVKTPIYLMGAGLFTVFMVTVISSMCGVFGIDLTSGDSCNGTAETPITSSVFFIVGLTGVFMVLIGTVWTIKAYFIDD